MRFIVSNGWFVLFAVFAQVKECSPTKILININPPGSKLHRYGYPELLVRNLQILFITCEVKTYEKYRITWLRNGQRIQFPPPYTIPWKNGLILYVRPVQRGVTDGLFQCNVQIDDTTYSKGVRVLVTNEVPFGFPQVNSHPADVHTRRRRVDFRCEVSGTPPLTITWFHNSLPVQDDNVHKVLPYFIKTSGKKTFYTSNLIVNDTSSAKKGFYRCVISNPLGQVVSRQASIRFNDKRLKRKRKSSGVAYNQEGDCGNTDGVGGSTSGEEVRYTCTYDKTEGYYFSVQWFAPNGGKTDIDITSYIVTFYSYCDHMFHCFRHNDTKSNTFNYGSEQRMDSSCKYEVSIASQPTASGTSFPALFIGKCPDDAKPSISPKTVTTSQVVGGIKKKTSLGPILGGVMVFLVLAIVFSVLCVWRRKKGEGHYQRTDQRVPKQVYISYFLPSRDGEKRIIRLAACMQKYYMEPCVDLLSTVEINRAGGLPHWIPDKMETSDKILLVLSSAYLKALKAIDNAPSGQELEERICKVHSEYNHVKNLMFLTCHKAPQLVILLDDVKKEYIPECLKTRLICYLPKHFTSDDEEIHKLMGLLCNTEPVQLMEPVHKLEQTII